ncbi:MAG: DUF2189 domain-containing protein [Thiomicrospira sp.]|uniref:DUF2189 domain-containing protein n=1 Tax=Thiomicrospira sp. TaxID=935 RepID=UPI0019DBB6E8|nr:DUF2189 domain-containing protein [Thiomicrospira sp.]MBE0494596.1 DUF2189 domain-containing protein [Thiomicrospira sp.]
MSNQAISTQQHDHYTEAGEHIISRDVKLSDIGRWLKNGWHDMAHAPGISMFYGLVMSLSVVLVFFAFQHQPIHMFTVATVFILLSPFMATGLYYTAQKLEQGNKPSLGESMVAWKENVSDIAFFAAALGVITAMWATFTPLLAAIVVGSSSLLIINPNMGIMGFLTSEVGLTFLAIFASIGLILSAFVFAISVVTIPLLLRDKKMGAVSAMILSFKIVMENKMVMAAWALVIGFMLTVGIMSLGLGMLIVMPLLGYASWHAFNDLVEIDGKV